MGHLGAAEHLSLSFLLPFLKASFLLLKASCIHNKTSKMDGTEGESRAGASRWGGVGLRQLRFHSTRGILDMSCRSFLTFPVPSG